MESGIDILLVEDNPHDVELTLHALKKNRIANPIHVARDGAEAIAFIYRDDPDAKVPLQPLPRLILLDLKLPKISGIEVLRRLKNDPRTKCIPVVVLTSSKEEQDIAASYDLGVNSYIVKPVDFPQFVEAIRNLGLYWLLLNEAPPRHGNDVCNR